VFWKKKEERIKEIGLRGVGKGSYSAPGEGGGQEDRRNLVDVFTYS
jgi:hypothetical protein